MPKETITVKKVGDKCVRATNGKNYFIGFNSGLSLSSFAEGQSYEVDTFTNPKGFYIIQKMIQGIGDAQEPPPYVAPNTTAETVNKYGGKTWEEYNSEKNDRILQQGLLQACLQSPGISRFGNDYESYMENVIKAWKKCIFEMTTHK